MAIGELWTIPVPITKDGGTYGNITVEIQEEYDATNNTSTLSVTKMTGSNTLRSGNFYTAGTISVDGSTWYSWNDGNWTFAGLAGDSEFTSYSGATYPSGIVIAHNSDGSKSINISVTVSDYYGGSPTWYGSGGTVTETVALTTIPRQSSVSASDGTLGSALTISVTAANSSFTHTLKYSIGKASGTIATKTSSTSVSWTPAKSLCNQITNAASGTCKITCETYSGDTLVGSKSCNIKLTIPVSTVTGTSGEIGKSLSIVINRAGGNLTHTLKYSIGSAGGTIATKTTSTSVSWAPAMSICNQITAATSGTCTITCDTYNGSVLIGSKTASVKLTVPSSIKLTVSSGWAKVAAYNTGTLADQTAFAGKYVQGYSKAEVTFDGSKISTANAYGATVKSYKIEYGGKTISASPYRTATLTAVGAQEITCTVTDTRGRTVSAKLNFTVQSYAKPALSGAAVRRCNSKGEAAEDGTYISAVAKMTVSSVDGTNSGTLRVRYRVSGGSYGSYTTLTSGTAKVIGNGAISATVTYEAEIRVTDTLGNTAIMTFTVPTADVMFHARAGGRGAAFGKFAESEDLLDVAWGLRVRGGARFDKPPYTNLNLLDNWYFKDPINQRGESSYLGARYAIDRWRSWGSGGAALKVVSGGIQIAQSYMQYMENARARLLIGHTVTVSLKMKDGTVYSASGGVNSTSGAWVEKKIGAHGIDLVRFGDEGFGTEDENWLFIIMPTTSGTFTDTIESVKLEVGDVSTLANDAPPNKALELMKCQRYYENSWHGCDNGINSRIANHATVWSTTQADGRIPYKVHKRSVPTVTFHAEGSLANWTVYHGGQHMPVSKIATAGGKIWTDALVFRMTRDSTNDTAWTVGDTMETRGHWEASADL